jgi:5-(carboxyamino)imidazole ribonucleotide mutase
MTKPFIAILMGSDSDWEVMQLTVEVLNKFQVPFEVKVLSAHRTPEMTHQYVKEADGRGCAVFIAAAGLAAHLAGTIAALTIRPVIGVPMAAGSLKGLDALLSTVQMPGGTPVATVAIGSAGAKNAGYLALQILSLQNDKLAQQLREERLAKVNEIKKINERLFAS